MPRHGVDLQAAADVGGIVPAQRQAATKARHGRDALFSVGLVRIAPVLADRLRRGVQVRPDLLHLVQGNSSARVGDAHHNSGFVTADDHTDRVRRETLGSVHLCDSTQGILQELKGDVVQVLAYEREANLPGIDDVHGGCATVVVLAEPRGVAGCGPHDADRVALRVDHRGGPGGPCDGQVLRAQDVGADPGNQEIVQELVDLVVG
mmetsp:Transcript_5895/g.17585  ORF Transcript_5895/g.17585 Transcript_5895/m.17585 type:complete len:206 (-) Transcript_5895:711-1328(-)